MRNGIFVLSLVMLLLCPASADDTPQAKGSATITVGDDTATWPVWRCARVVIAHALPDDSILEDPHLKLIDYGDVIQMVLKLKGKNYLADVPAGQTMSDIDYEGLATRINSADMTNMGEVRFSMRVECNP
ncbi:MAG: hypothetical protein AB8F65_00505 [Woeseiaceae bacterium]